MNLELMGKTALISGSTKGIGFAIASRLAAEGARVIVNGGSDQSVNSALEQVRKAAPEAKVEGFASDLATTTATEALVNRFPAVDILVNNLGSYEPKPFDEISDEDWRHVLEVNVLSGVRLSRAYVSGMKQRNWGRIIFISSFAVQSLQPSTVPLCASMAESFHHVSKRKCSKTGKERQREIQTIQEQ